MSQKRQLDPDLEQQVQIGNDMLDKLQNSILELKELMSNNIKELPKPPD